jgi:large conductance mechanosensitive channel
MSTTRNLWKEFKGFALKGSVMDLAVAVVIGNAFGAVVKSLVDHIVVPLLSYLQLQGGGYRGWHIGRVAIGAFLSEALNFVMISLAMFLIVVKLMGSVRKAVPFLDDDEPANKECPFCLSNIPYKASKCSHCTADLPKSESAPAKETHG